jgi:hypothetical protein
MNTGRIFWGVFLLVVGVLFLAHGVLPVLIDWTMLWKFWPLALVLGGCSLLLRKHRARFVVTIAGAVLLALFVYGLFSFLSPFEQRSHREGREFTDRIAVPLSPSVSSAALVLEIGAGRCLLSGGAEGLLEASASGTFGRYVLEQRTEGEEEQLALRLTSRDNSWKFWHGSNTIGVRLSELPLWSIALECGAARAEVDLSSCTIRDLHLKAGASSVKIRLGATAADTRVRVEAGASSISLEIPESAGCEIRIDGPLTRKRFTGFTREQSGLYRTGGFEGAEKKIFVDVDAGVSSIRITRYGA